VFNGHIARFSEGNYCGFFGWQICLIEIKVSRTPKSDIKAMRIVDIYRRENNKLAENWVYIDILYYLYQQGLDLLGRMKEMKSK
jgi:hypothetical protein